MFLGFFMNLPAASSRFEDFKGVFDDFGAILAVLANLAPYKPSFFKPSEASESRSEPPPSFNPHHDNNNYRDNHDAHDNHDHHNSLDPHEKHEKMLKNPKNIPKKSRKNEKYKNTKQP